MKCVIVGAGDLDPARLPKKEPGDLYVAADGGLAAFAAAGVQPDFFIGDLDSIENAPAGLPAKYLPVVKDDTDVAAACRYGLEQGYRKFFLFGALGGKRFSHSVANVQLLRWLKDRNADGVIEDAFCTVRLLRNEKAVPERNGHRFFSLFALSESAEVSIENAKYPLDHARLSARFPLGVSNEFQGETRIDVTDGDVLLVIDG